MEPASSVVELCYEPRIITPVAVVSCGEIIEPAPKRLSRFRFKLGAKSFPQCLLQTVNLSTESAVILLGEFEVGA